MWGSGSFYGLVNKGRAEKGELQAPDVISFRKSAPDAEPSVPIRARRQAA